MDQKLLTLEYISVKLALRPELVNILEAAAIVWYASSSFIEKYDPIVVRDLLIVLPDEIFVQFEVKHGKSFVVDDHEVVPPVFARIKNFNWLDQDFARRLPLALWIYQHAIVLKDPDEHFARMLHLQQERFIQSVPAILRSKYLEFRTERHNLRHNLADETELANRLIKAVVVKLALEIIFLAEKKPYPYKKWLFWATKKETANGTKVLDLAQKFWDEKDKDLTITLSDQLVEKIASIVIKSGLLSEDIANRWWLYLD